MNENESGSGPTPPPPPRPAVPPPPPPPQSSSTPPSPPPPPDWNNLTALQIRHRPDRTSQKFHFGIWVGLWISLCMLVMWGLALRRGDGFNGELVGRSFGASLSLWLLAYAAGWALWRISDRNQQAGQWSAAVTAGLLLMASIGTDLRSERLHQEQVAVAQDLSRTLESVTVAADGNAPMPAVDTSATVGGVSGEFQAFIKTYLNRNVTLQNEYNQEMTRAGWTTVLDPTKVSAPGALEADKEVAERCSKIVQKYHRRWQALFTQTLVDLKAMEGKSSLHRDYVRGFRSSAAPAQLQAERIWALESGIVRTTDDMISLLISTRGSWEQKSGQLVFASEPLLDRFNDQVRMIQRMSDEEVQIRTASRSKIRQSLEEMASP